MQQGVVLVNGIKAATIACSDTGQFTLQYLDSYLADTRMPGISLTLPKTQKRYESPVLFPFFYGMLTEGINKEMQCRLLKIDEEDSFTHLLAIAGGDTIGAVNVVPEQK